MTWPWARSGTRGWSHRAAGLAGSGQDMPPRGSGLGSEARLWDGEGIWTHLFVISGVRAGDEACVCFNYYYCC